MPPKPPASTFAPSALGAALLGLSAVLLAVDVGGTVVLDAPAQPAQPAPPPVSLARHVYEPPAAARPNDVAPGRRPAVLATERPAPAQRQPPIATAQAVQAVRPVAVALAPPALARSARAPRTAAQPVRSTPAVTQIASLSDVRHFAMRRLATSYPNISVISADTYSIGGDNVRVSMVVESGSQRWVEKDVVKRSGTSLALEKSARHGMPYASAATPEPSLTVGEPESGP